MESAFEAASKPLVIIWPTRHTRRQGGLDPRTRLCSQDRRLQGVPLDASSPLAFCIFFRQRRVLRCRHGGRGVSRQGARRATPAHGRLPTLRTARRLPRLMSYRDAGCLRPAQRDVPRSQTPATPVRPDGRPETRATRSWAGACGGQGSHRSHRRRSSCRRSRRCLIAFRNQCGTRHAEEPRRLRTRAHHPARPFGSS